MHGVGCEGMDAAAYGFKRDWTGNTYRVLQPFPYQLLRNEVHSSPGAGLGRRGAGALPGTSSSRDGGPASPSRLGSQSPKQRAVHKLVRLLSWNSRRLRWGSGQEVCTRGGTSRDLGPSRSDVWCLPETLCFGFLRVSRGQMSHPSKRSCRCWRT